MRRIAVFALLALAGCSGSDGENETAGFRPPTAIDKADFIDNAPRRFNRLDRDHNGVLEASDFPRRPDRLKLWDSDGNGSVTVPEYTAAETRRFAAADTDRDNVLTTAERQAVNWNGRDDDEPAK